jgi:hypothetical protein
MPLEEQIGDAAGAVEAADTGIREWKTIMAAAKSAPPGAVLHTMTVSGCYGRSTVVSDVDGWGLS